MDPDATSDEAKALASRGEHKPLLYRHARALRKGLDHAEFDAHMRELHCDPDTGVDMEPLKELVHRAFRRSYKKKSVPEGQTPIAAAVQQAAADADNTANTVEESVEQVDPEGVGRFACMLEATLAMGEQVPDDHVLSIEFPLGDLRSFVSYMRELDSSYRKVLEIATGEIQKAKEKRERPNLILPPGARKK